MESVIKQIESKITSRKRGVFVFPADFASLGTPESITKSLQRLKASGVLIRVAHGVYYYPKIDTKYGLGAIPPTILEIAYAIAGRDKARIYPTGAFAMHALGFTTQVPANVVFVTDGAQRRITIGKGKGILFKHSDEARNFAYWSKEFQLIVSALREIGEENVTAEQLETIKGLLNTICKEKFNHDISLAPAWIRKILLML